MHQFVVGIADRGPSTRALAVVAVGGLGIAVLSLLALPTMKRPPHEWPTSESAAAPPPDVTVVADDRSAVQPAPSPAQPAATRPAAAYKAPVEPVAAITAAIATPPVRIESPPAETPARVVNAPRVADAPRADSLPVGATGRPPIEMIVAPAATAREREPGVAQPVIARDETPAPRPAAEPRPVAEPEPRPGQTSE